MPDADSADANWLAEGQSPTMMPDPDWADANWLAEGQPIRR